MGARGAHAPAGVTERSGGDEGKEEAPLDPDRVAVAGGTTEHAVENEQGGPAAGDHHDETVAAGHMEVASLGAGKHQSNHACRDEEDGCLDE
jgi:hypothetical protein